MKINVRAKPGSKENKVVVPPQRLWKTDDKVDEFFAVYVKELPADGKANDAIIKLLARHFSIPSSQVRLVRGASSKTKVFEIIK